MEIQRTITLILPNDADVQRTLDAYRTVQQQLSPICYNNGTPLKAIPLQRVCYETIKGTLNSQMTITAMRAVAGAYASAKANRRPAKRPFLFARRRATFLIGVRGRDADFRSDGTLSIWTVSGRKHITYTIPAAFQDMFTRATELDSLTVIERAGRLLGRLTITLAAPDPALIHPVGIDLNETNAVVAVDADGNELFISGKDVKVRNIRTSKTRARIQQKLATHKADHTDTRSVRRVLKRLSRTRFNRTRTFAQQTAKQLIGWCAPNSVLVFEDLAHMPQPKRGSVFGKALRRRLSLWQRGAIRQAVTNKAEEVGMAVVDVDPAYTSKNCSRCGLRGIRKRHSFACPHCGHTAHADVNAAYNIRNRFTAFRSSAPPSESVEALSVQIDEGKSLA